MEVTFSGLKPFFKDHKLCATDLKTTTCQKFNFSKTLASEEAKRAFNSRPSDANSTEFLYSDENIWRRSKFPKHILPEKYGMIAVASLHDRMNLFQALSLALIGNCDEEKCIRSGTIEEMYKDHRMLSLNTKTTIIDEILANDNFFGVQIAYASKFLFKPIVAVCVGANFAVQNCTGFFPDENITESGCSPLALHLIFSNELFRGATLATHVYVEPLLATSSKAQPIPLNHLQSAIMRRPVENQKLWDLFCQEQKQNIVARYAHCFRNTLAMLLLSNCSKSDNVSSKTKKYTCAQTIKSVVKNENFETFLLAASERIQMPIPEAFNLQLTLSSNQSLLLDNGMQLYYPEDIEQPFFACVAFLITGCEDDAATVRALVINELIKLLENFRVDLFHENYPKLEILFQKVLRSILDAKADVHDIVFILLTKILDRPIERIIYAVNDAGHGDLFVNGKMKTENKISILQVKSNYFAAVMRETDHNNSIARKTSTRFVDIELRGYKNEIHCLTEVPKMVNEAFRSLDSRTLLPLLDDHFDISSSSAGYFSPEGNWDVENQELLACSEGHSLMKVTEDQIINELNNDIQVQVLERQKETTPSRLSQSHAKTNTQRSPHLSSSSHESVEIICDENPVSPIPKCSNPQSWKNFMQPIALTKFVKLSETSSGSDEDEITRSQNTSRNSFIASSHLLSQSESGKLAVVNYQLNRQEVDQRRSDSVGQVSFKCVSNAANHSNLNRELTAINNSCTYRYSKELFIVNGKIEQDYVFFPVS